MCCVRIYPDARLLLPYYCVFTTRSLLIEDNPFLGAELACIWDIVMCFALFGSCGFALSARLGMAYRLTK